MAMRQSETLFQNDSLDLRNRLAPNCKRGGRGELAPKDYFHGRTLSPVSGIAASHAAGKVASPSGSGVLGLPGGAFVDQGSPARCRRLSGWNAWVKYEYKQWVASEAPHPKSFSGSSRSFNTRCSYYTCYSHT